MRTTWRSLLRARAYSVLVVLTVSVAIGLTAAVFGTVRAVLRPASPFDEPGRLFTLWGQYGRTPRSPGGNAQIERALELMPALERVSTYRRDLAIVEGDEGTQQIRVAWVQADFFSVVGVRPAAGSFFDASDTLSSIAPRAVVSDEFFRHTINASRRSPGGEILVGGRAYRVIGVAPPTLGSLLSADLWLVDRPGAMIRSDPDAAFNAVVRVRPGLDRSALEERLRAVGPSWAAMATTNGALPRFHVEALAPEIAEFSDLNRALMWSVMAILIVACANLANLTLARALSREPTHAITRALGATRRRIALQVVGECALLSMCGGMLGVVVVVAMRGTIRQLIPVNVPYVGTLDVRLDWSAIGSALLMSVVIAVVFGAFPAIRASRADPGDAMKDAAGGRRLGRQRLYAGIIVVQIALALAMLTNASLLVRASERLRTLALGYQRAGLLEASVLLPRAIGTGSVSTAPAFEAILSSVRAIPEVSSVTWWASPPVGGLSIHGFARDGSQRTIFRPTIRSVGAGYLRTLGARVLDGRDVLDGDHEGALIAVIDQKVANALWPYESALQKQIAVNGAGNARAYATVIGIAANVRESFSNFDVFDVTAGAVYLSALPTTPFRTLLVRTSTSALPRVMADVAARVKDVAPAGTRLSVEPADADERRLEEGHRFVTWLFGALAACALALCLLGLYSILEYATVMRRREYAIRVALGGTPTHVARLVAREALPLVLGGTAIGGGISLLVTKLIDPFLLDLFRVDARALVAAECAVMISATLACLLPTLQAMRTRATETLRTT